MSNGNTNSLDPEIDRSRRRSITSNVPRRRSMESANIGGNQEDRNPKERRQSDDAILRRNKGDDARSARAKLSQFRPTLSVDDARSARRKSTEVASNEQGEARSPRRKSTEFGSNISEDDAKSVRRKSTEFGPSRRKSNAEDGSQPSSRSRRRSATVMAGVEMLPESYWTSLMPQWQRRTIFSAARLLLSHFQFEECSSPTAKLQLAARAVRQGLHNTVVQSKVVDLWKEVASEAQERKREEARAEAERIHRPPPPDVLLAEFRDLRGQLDDLRHLKTVCIPTRITSMMDKMNHKLMDLDKLRAMAAAHRDELENLKQQFDKQLGSVNKLKDWITEDMHRLYSTLKEQVDDEEGEVDEARKIEIKRTLFVVDHCLVTLGVMSNSLSLWRPQDDESSSDSDGLLDEEDRQLEMQTSRCRNSRGPSFLCPRPDALSTCANPDIDSGSGESNAARPRTPSFLVGEELQSLRGRLSILALQLKQADEQGDHQQTARLRAEMVVLRSQEERLQTKTPVCELESPANQEFKQSEQLEQCEKRSEQCDDQQDEQSRPLFLRSGTRDQRLNTNESLSNGEILPDLGINKKRFSKSETPTTASSTNQNEELVQSTGQSEAVRGSPSYSEAVRRGLASGFPGKKLFAAAKPSEPKPRYHRSREQYSMDNLTPLHKQLLATILKKDSSTAELIDLMIEHSASEKVTSKAISPDPLSQPKKTLLPEPVTSRTSSPRTPCKTSGRTSRPSSRMNSSARGNSNKSVCDRSGILMMEYSLPVLVGRRKYFCA